MAGLAWQEPVISFVPLTIHRGIPAPVVALASVRRTGAVQTGRVVTSLVFSWLGLVPWAIFGGERGA